jgi:hypothetical protein
MRFNVRASANYLLIVIIFSCFTGILTLNFDKAQAQRKYESQSQTHKPKKKKGRFRPQPIPVGIGSGTVLKGRSSGAGSQGPCSGKEDTSLIALIPQDKSNNVWSPTRRSAPTLIFYIAYPKGTEIYFSLEDNHRRISSSTRLLKAVDQSILLRLTLPSKTLSADQPYHWTLGIKCDSRQESYDDFVEGGVYRISSSEVPVASSNLSLEDVWIQAEDGFWLDALDDASKLMRDNTNSDEIKSDWIELLKQGEISQSIILGRSQIVDHHVTELKTQ